MTGTIIEVRGEEYVVRSNGGNEYAVPKMGTAFTAGEIVSVVNDSVPVRVEPTMGKKRDG